MELEQSFFWHGPVCAGGTLSLSLFTSFDIPGSVRFLFWPFVDAPTCLHAALVVVACVSFPGFPFPRFPRSNRLRVPPIHASMAFFVSRLLPRALPSKPASVSSLPRMWRSLGHVWMLFVDDSCAFPRPPSTPCGRDGQAGTTRPHVTGPWGRGGGGVSSLSRQGGRAVPVDVEGRIEDRTRPRGGSRGKKRC